MTGIRGFACTENASRRKHVFRRERTEGEEALSSVELIALGQAFKFLMNVSGSNKSATKHLEKKRRCHPERRNAVANVQLFGSASQSSPKAFEEGKIGTDSGEGMGNNDLPLMRCGVQEKRNTEAHGCKSTTEKNWEQDHGYLLAPVSLLADTARKATVDAPLQHYQVLDSGVLNDCGLSAAVPMNIKLEPSLVCVILSNQAIVMEPQLVDYQIEE